MLSVRETLTETVAFSHSQWEDPSLWDHSYGEQQGVEETAEDATTQTEDFSYSMLQSDADSFLYTGVSLETFNSLVSTLEGFAERASVLSVRDQILMTLIKLKLNRVLGDLGRQFHVSQSVASKVISFWIDKMEELLLSGFQKKPLRPPCQLHSSAFSPTPPVSSTVAKVCYRRRKILTLEESPTAITTRTIQSSTLLLLPHVA